MNYLFMTQSHHDVTSLDIVIFFYFVINMFAHADVTVLVIFDGRQDVLVLTGYYEYYITCAKITVLLRTLLCEHI
jgi:hypothetical protein